MEQQNNANAPKKRLPVDLNGIRSDLLFDGNLVRLSIIMVVSFVLMALLNPELYLTNKNFMSMAYQFPEIGLFSIAVMIAMLMGGINLSVLGIGNLSAIVSAYTMIALAPSMGNLGAICAGIVVSLLVGIVCGALNGFLIARVGIPAMLATLGTMEMFSGIGIFLTDGSAVFGLPEGYEFIGAGTLLGIPIPTVIFIAVAGLCTVLLQKKKFGLEIYLLGTNEKAARFTGIQTKRDIIKAHMLGGLLSAIAGIIMSSRTISAKADYGSSYTLQCILVAVLGGVNPSGGFGKVTGVVMAILTLQFLSSGFNIMRADSYFKTFVWGAVLIATLIINHYGNKNKGRRKKSAAQ
ncbi:MAG TPA: ABC transporter permease [Feifaniaceae bacterium]|nr:ABC transporter permease [Feifaniaceae bacterium]